MPRSGTEMYTKLHAAIDLTRASVPSGATPGKWTIPKWMPRSEETSDPDASASRIFVLMPAFDGAGRWLTR